MHFISGLPRSGSTLLSAILKQNPRFSAGMSSSLLPLFASSINVMAGEGSALIPESRRESVLHGLFNSWAADLPAGTVVFDTNRLWTAHLPALLKLFPNAKIICMVRSVAAIMDSIERLIRANPLLPPRLFGDDERQNIYTRTDALSQRNRLVGAPWTSLKEAFYGPDADHLLVVDYDYLALAPAKVISLIYQFLGETPFVHDFENLNYDEPNFDEELRMPGLHKVRPRVHFEPRPSLLPHDLRERFKAQSFWLDPQPSEANLILPRPQTMPGAGSGRSPPPAPGAPSTQTLVSSPPASPTPVATARRAIAAHSEASRPAPVERLRDAPLPPSRASALTPIDDIPGSDRFMIRIAAMTYAKAAEFLPSSWCSNFGAVISHWPRRQFASTHNDMKAMFAAIRPDWATDTSALESAARRAWSNVARVCAEVPLSQRLVDQGRVTIENVARIDEVMALNRPVILVYVHTGNWELSGIHLARRYHPMRRGLAIYHPPHNTLGATIVQQERRKMPADLVPHSPMVWRHALTHLRKPGGVLFVSADEAIRGTVGAPLFGRRPFVDGNLGKIVRLAMRTNAVVIPFYGERHRDLHFSTHILRPMVFSGDPADDQTVMAAVQAMDTVLVSPIVRLLDQWFMALFYRGKALPPPMYGVAPGRTEIRRARVIAETASRENLSLPELPSAEARPKLRMTPSYMTR